MTNYDVVKKLIGPITPVADSAIDEKRSKNLIELLDLMDSLMEDIIFVSNSSKSPYHSEKEIGVIAKDWLDEVVITIKEIK